MLLSVIAWRYRVDVTRCAVWPSPWTSSAYAFFYCVAVGLLSATWWQLSERARQDDGLSTKTVLGYALLLHLIVFCAPPFLSDDVLFYAALGRGLSLSPGNATAPLCTMLPPDDRFLTILDVHWRCSVSAYWPGFHLIARAVGRLGGDSLSTHLRLYQLVSMAAILSAAVLTSAALRGSNQRPAYGAALVALNPLSLIEATMNAHNDALLALSCALFVFCVQARRPGRALLGLGLGLAVKASALLPLVVYLMQRVLEVLRRRSLLLWRALPLGLGLGLMAALLFLALHPSALPGLSGLIGSPHAPWEYCTRSIECLPRAVLRWVLHRPTAAWSVGLGFRLLGGLWLIYAAWRAQRGLLPWLGTALLVYYLYLHGWSQSWYFLPLLPLLPFAVEKTSAALRCVSISACAYYALVLVGNCFRDELAIALFDLSQGLVVVVPPSVVLLSHRRGAYLVRA